MDKRDEKRNDELMNRKITTASTTNQVRTEKDAEVRVPVVEEELQVGKREVEKGGVRVTSKVESQPVAENINLREEHVTVDRQPVNRPLSPADANAFQEKTYEVREKAEQPVVSKQARVVEEVSVGKTATQHTETIRDTVRRTDVQIQPIVTQEIRGLDRYETDFRKHYDTSLSASGFSYDNYQPAFQYGGSLASEQRFRGQDWSRIEPEARTTWESKNPGTWESFKDSVRYAWERMKNG